MDIMKMQDKLKDMGYQWREHIFNDDFISADCYLEISRSTNPCVFLNDDPKTLGWGRFSRERCWSMALDFVSEQENETQ